MTVPASFLASTLVMGALIALVLVAVARNRRWHSYSAEARVGRSPEDDARPETATPTGWIVGFFALIVLVVGGVFAFVTNPDAPAGPFSLPVLVVGGALLVGYLLVGTYYAAKGRGHPSSIAAAETATVFGVLLLVAVTSQLVG